MSPYRLRNVLILSLLLAPLAACGGDADGGRKSDTRAEVGESGLDDAGAPLRGGRLVYGLEAESSDGWCLPEARLAISGLMVQWALYDSLTGEEVRWGLENLKIDDKRIDELGLKGVMQPINTSCQDHAGAHSAR